LSLAWKMHDTQSNDELGATRFALRFLGVLDLLAFLAVIAPRPTIDRLNQLCDLPPLPEGPLVGYLARSASLLYAFHGAILLFISFNPVRYLPLIRFMAWAAILHGGGMFVIDYFEEMPLWWRYTEGPGFALTGALILCTLPGMKSPRVVTETAP
jgi:hypothetical protein